MNKMGKISELINEMEKISGIEKCLTCQCFYDALLEFKEVLRREKDAKMEERLARIIEKAAVTHGCLGCEPCYPVPVSNVLSEMVGGSFTCSCDSTCKPVEVTLLRELRESSWPVEQGEYIIGDQTSPVAISTLGSDALPETIAGKTGIERFAIVGKTHTENIGIEKVVRNTISNPHIRFLIICGNDTKGHMAGQSLVSLFNGGVNQEKRITGSKGKRPVLKNLEFSEIEHFRSQVELIDLIGSEDVEKVEKEVRACIAKNPGKFNKAVTVRKVPHTEARPSRKLTIDPSGFFIIYPKKEEGRIYLEHYRADATLNEVIFGEDPISIALTVIEHGLVSRLDHAAYLGKELEKAFLSMAQGFQYIQDSATGEEKKS